MGNEVIQNKSRTLVQYASVSLTAGNQTKNTVVIPTTADIIGLDWDLKVTAAGTLVGAKTVEKSIQRIVLSDKNGKEILDCAGEDLPKLSMWLSPKGSYDTPETATDATAKYYQDVLEIKAALANQPISMQVTFAPYSALADSGCTGATVDLTLNAWYGSNLENETTRIYKRSVSVVSGDNAMGMHLVNGKNTKMLTFSIGTESNLNSIDFSSDGSMTDLSNLLPQMLKNLENDEYRDEHQTGMFNLFVTPFKADTTNTGLNFNCAGSDTINIYQFANN